MATTAAMQARVLRASSRASSRTQWAPSTALRSGGGDEAEGLFHRGVQSATWIGREPRSRLPGRLSMATSTWAARSRSRRPLYTRAPLHRRRSCSSAHESPLRASQKPCSNTSHMSAWTATATSSGSPRSRRSSSLGRCPPGGPRGLFLSSDPELKPPRSSEQEGSAFERLLSSVLPGGPWIDELCGAGAAA